jgi:MoaA/NifB/PqqE/SkfB family radical SAM enzyme
MKSSIPGVVNLETVNYCNARCPFCPLFQGGEPLQRTIRPAATMAMELFKKLIGEIASWEKLPDVIYLNMDGEPLLDPMIQRRIRLLKEAGLNRRVGIQTNGEFLTGEVAENILDHEIGSITVSFDGAQKETYECHRPGCHYDRVLENIRGFLATRRRKEKDTHLVIKYVVTPENRTELADARHLFAPLLDPRIDSLQAAHSVNWGSTALESDRFVLDKASQFRGPVSGCSMFETKMIILADGRIPACCYDYNLDVYPGSLGDAATMTLLDIWNGEARNRMRTQLHTDRLEMKPKKCRDCAFSFAERVLSPADYDLTGEDILAATRFGLILKLIGRS